MAEATVSLSRLDEKQLAAVRQAVGGISINQNTTPLQAGFQLGVARVLDVLRDGFTTTPQAPARQ